MVISADIPGRDRCGLTAGDRLALLETAQTFGAILVVAEPDERLRDIQGRPDTVPARPGLAALAADRDDGARRVRHFVVDRGAVPEAFSEGRHAEADAAWQRLLASHGASTSEELNDRSRRGLTPYSVDLKPRSPTFGVLRERGRLVHSGLALRDVIAVPIHVESAEQWESEAVTVSASRESVTPALAARLGRRIELADRATEEEAGAAAYTPALRGEGAAGAVLEVALRSLGDLGELRELAGLLRTLRAVPSDHQPRPSTLSELRSVALAQPSGMTSP